LIGLEPTGEREERKPMFGMTWEEAKRAAKDQEGLRLVVRALCSKGNDEG